MKKLLLIPIVLLLAATAQAADPQMLEGEQVFIIQEYRYEPGDSGGDPDIGHALCGTRCNALSVDYRNFIDPGGWRFIRVADNREIPVSLNNPFIGGQCVCTADEYVVILNDFNKPHTPTAGK